MTQTEVLTAGRELDARIATEVMGWTDVGMGIDLAGRVNGPYGDDPENPGIRGRSMVPGYSTDIAAAWTVVERFTSATKVIGHSGGIDLEDRWQFQLQCNHNWMWDATFAHLVDRNSVGTDEEEFFAQSETAPKAICLAALKAVGHDH